jgi:cobalt-precorrin 5A hydrolase/precorrin-3B C17-methyltransferase
VSDTTVLAVTDAGERLGRLLPYKLRRAGRDDGGLMRQVADAWEDADRLVLVGATGIAVRAIAPLLGSKQSDPAVVCLDDGGRWAIALSGGHHGANDLAREVAALTGAEPVVTTASDHTEGVLALDTLPGFTATGDIAGVTRRWLDGTPPRLDLSDLPSWPSPRWAPPKTTDSGGAEPNPAEPVVRVTDRARARADGEVVLRPPSLVLGVGSSSGADAGGLRDLVERELAAAGLAAASVGLVATIDLKSDEPAIVALADHLGVDLRTFPAETLAGIDVPTPSAVVEAEVGTPSVAEAAALAAAGSEAELVVAKQRSAEATVAVARRLRPEGHLSVVGLGPGEVATRTPAAAAAVRHAEVVIGYGPYIDLASDLLEPRHEVVRSPIGAEADRCADALTRAAAGQTVALVCSGDPGVYAMASLVGELAPGHGNPRVTMVPGVTAALSAAAVLGAPLGHDHVSISLSDLLTPWEAIERRLVAAAESDLVVSLYNPRSRRRVWQLERALEILAKHRPDDCPAAIAIDVGRPAQRIVRTTLTTLDPDDVDMLSLVMVGASTTRWLGGRMVTPRGYVGGGGMQP